MAGGGCRLGSLVSRSGRPGTLLPGAALSGREAASRSIVVRGETRLGARGRRPEVGARLGRRSRSRALAQDVRAVDGYAVGSRGSRRLDAAPCTRCIRHVGKRYLCDGTRYLRPGRLAQWGVHDPLVEYADTPPGASWPGYAATGAPMHVPGRPPGARPGLGAASVRAVQRSLHAQRDQASPLTSRCLPRGRALGDEASRPEHRLRRHAPTLTASRRSAAIDCVPAGSATDPRRRRPPAPPAEHH